MAAATAASSRAQTARWVLALLLLVGTCAGVLSCSGALDGATGGPVAFVNVSPSAFGLSAGTIQQLLATAGDANGQAVIGPTITWATSAPSVATVSSGGRVTGVAAGAATITATSGGASGTATVTVNGPVAVVAVVPSLDTAFTGATPRFTATLWDAIGNTLGRTITWTSSNTAVATVNSASGVTAVVAPGTAMITALAEGKSGSATLVVSNPVASVSVTPDTVTLVSGAAQQFTATPRDAAGTTVAGRTVYWRSNDTSVAKVSVVTSPTTVATAGAAGTAYIVAQVDGIRDSARLVRPGIPFASLAVGWFHTCALTTAGAAYCWGSNTYGQLGDGTTTTRTARVPVQGGIVFRSIAAGGAQTCGLSVTSRAYCWGDNVEGALGDGTAASRSSPVPVQGGLVFTSLATGNDHSCGLTASGAAYCWGNNANGQLGDGTMTNRSIPVPVQGGFAFTQLAAGIAYTCGLNVAGATYCWGDPALTPTATAVGLSFGSLAGGAEHRCGLVNSGAAYCWGRDDSGQLGNPNVDILFQYPPVPVVQNGLIFSALAAGYQTTCALTNTGGISCWGNVSTSANGPLTALTAPIGQPFTSVGVGGNGDEHVCGLTASGAAYCWGANGDGQLGIGTNNPYTTFLTPKKVIQP